MNGEVGNEKQSDEVDRESVDAFEEIDTVEKIDSVEEIDTVGDADNVGDISVEINVEELVAKVEAADGDDFLESVDALAVDFVCLFSKLIT